MSSIHSTLLTLPLFQPAAPSDGALWWMNRDLKDKKEKYGARK
jgi:hypothetical protein